MPNKFLRQSTIAIDVKIIIKSRQETKKEKIVSNRIFSLLNEMLDE